MSDFQQPGQARNQTATVFDILPLFSLTLLIGAYFVLRYAGLWAETDTATITMAIRSVAASGKLIPEAASPYANGYAYQVIVTFLSQMTGISILDLQQKVLPYAIVFLVAPVFVLFYEVTASTRRAVLASALLFMQPEFLFVILRGSHEKFGRLFMVLALFLFFRSFRYQDNVRKLTAYIISFYIVVYALLASNLLIGFSFVAALTFSLLVGATLKGLRFRNVAWMEVINQRTVWTVVVCFILAFLLIFYLYPPVQIDLLVLNGILNKIKTLMLGAESTNVYSVVIDNWISPQIYLFVNISNWFILITSFLIWAYIGGNWLFRKQLPKSRSQWLLWVLYTAYGMQAVLAIISDASGFVGNLQHRLFPSFTIIAVGMVSDNLFQVKPIYYAKRPVQVAIGFLAVFFVISSLIKSTNEASLVDYWVFYTKPELKALQWIDLRAEKNWIWIGFSGRLREAFRFNQGASQNKNSLINSLGETKSEFILISNIIFEQASRYHQNIPDVFSAYTVYDNGAAKIYHRRPQTVYQR